MDAKTKRHSRRFKGSVLFTVLVVMVVMVILMITAIGLAGASSRRAYSEYFDHQTTSTGRSVINSVVESFKTTNQGMGNSIVSEIQNGPKGKQVEVTVNGGANLGEGFGTVDHLYFTYVGKDDASDINITGSGQAIIKVTAVVTQGGTTSTYSQYCMGAVASNNQVSSGGGLIALGGFEATEQPGGDAHSPAYFGVKNAFTYDKLVKLSNPNQGEFNEVIVNSSAESTTSMKFALAKKEGFSVMGSLFVKNGTTKLFSIDNHTAAQFKDEVNAGGVQPTDNSYLYVGGTLYLVNNLEVGNTEAPMNVYCGRFVTENNGNLVGNCDIFCYNEGSTAASYDQSNLENFSKNPWSKFGTANQTKLLSWAEQISDTAHRKTVNDSGSFYTKGNLELTGKAVIEGDLYVKGDVNVHDLTNGEAAIKGNAYVGGSINNVAALRGIVAGELYYGAADNAADNTKAFSSSALPSKVNDFLSGTLTRDNLTSKIIKTPERLYNSFYVDEKNESGVLTGKKIYKDSVNKSLLEVKEGTKVYRCPENGKVQYRTINESTWHDVTGGTTPDGFAYKAEITESCILTGNFNGASLYINPSSEIWIDCFFLRLSNNSEILINDSDGKTKVNFFFPTDKTSLKQSNVDTSCQAAYKDLFNTSDGDFASYANGIRTDAATKIQTVAYYKHWKDSGGMNLITYPGADSDTTNDWMLPKVGFYSAGNDGTPTVLVQFTNNIFLTGDILMPSAEFYAKSGDTDAPGGTINYNGRKIEAPDSIGCIGSIIVDKIKDFHNDFGMVYVDDPATLPPGGNGGGTYAWASIDGYADF